MRSPAEAVLASQVVSQPRRILIVDDEPQIRRLLELVFEEAGYEVRSAENVDTAIALLHSAGCDLLLSDVTMPGGNGHDLAQWVGRRQPDTRTILMSGYDGVGCKDCRIPARPCVLVKKPFAPGQLLNLAGSLLGCDKR